MAEEMNTFLFGALLSLENGSGQGCDVSPARTDTRDKGLTRLCGLVKSFISGSQNR